MKSMGFFRAFMFGLSANFFCVALVRGNDTLMPALATGFLVSALSWDRP